MANVLFFLGEKGLLFFFLCLYRARGMEGLPTDVAYNVALLADYPTLLNWRAVSRATHGVVSSAVLWRARLSALTRYDKSCVRVSSLKGSDAVLTLMRTEHVMQREKSDRRRMLVDCIVQVSDSPIIDDTLCDMRLAVVDDRTTLCSGDHVVIQDHMGRVRHALVPYYGGQTMRFQHADYHITGVDGWALLCRVPRPPHLFVVRYGDDGSDGTAAADRQRRCRAWSLGDDHVYAAGGLFGGLDFAYYCMTGRLLTDRARWRLKERFAVAVADILYGSESTG